MAKHIKKYLDNYAEDEVNHLKDFNYNFAHVLIIPVYAEPDLLSGLLNNIPPGIDGDVLVIVIVNAHTESKADVIQQNNILIQQVQTNYQCLWSAKLLSLYQANGYKLLLVNRNREENLLSPEQAVGYARKIASDLAVQLYLQGNLKTTWLHSTDADVKLPADYFQQTKNLSNASAAVYAFKHQVYDDPKQAQAMRLYEISLRYYVLGLRWAKSNYAYHTIGSTIAINIDAYAKARGFPKRAAGEDFYLLNKLAKLGKVLSLQGKEIIIQGRLSARTPFGTGVALTNIIEFSDPLTEYELYNPCVFNYVALWNENLEQANTIHSLSELQQQLTAKCNNSQHANIFLKVLEQIGFNTAYTKIISQTKSTQQYKQQLHTWFDGFKTLKLIHGLRDQLFTSKPVMMALRSAEHLNISADPTNCLETVLENLIQLEKDLLFHTSQA